MLDSYWPISAYGVRGDQPIRAQEANIAGEVLVLAVLVVLAVLAVLAVGLAKKISLTGL